MSNRDAKSEMLIDGKGQRGNQDFGISGDVPNPESVTERSYDTFRV